MSFYYAFKGIGTLLRSEPNARIHLFMAIMVAFSGWFFSVSIQEWCWLILCICLVLFAEAVNTALETLVDLVSPDQHPLAGRAKDLAAAAVLFCSIGSATIGLIIFLPKGWAWLQQFLAAGN